MVREPMTSRWMPGKAPSGPIGHPGQSSAQLEGPSGAPARSNTMTAEIINLRRARKAKARADRARQADENRVRFGRTKGERKKSKAESTAAARRLDGHRRDEDRSGEEH